MSENKTFKEKISFLFKEMFPRLFQGKKIFYTITNTISGGLQLVLPVVVLKYILDSIYSQSADIQKVIIMSLIYSFGYVLSNIVNRMMTNKSNYTFLNERMDLIATAVSKVTKMDHEIYEDPNLMLKLNQAFGGIGGDNLGYQLALNKLFNLFPTIFAVIVF